MNSTTCIDIDECDDVGNGGCSGSCTNTVGSYECDCAEGLSLALNRRQCEDNNECLDDDPPRCQSGETCVNSYTAYYCIDNTIFAEVTGNGDQAQQSDMFSPSRIGNYDTATVALAITLGVVLTAVIIGAVVYTIRHFRQQRPNYNDLSGESTVYSGTGSSLGGFSTVTEKVSPSQTGGSAG